MVPGHMISWSERVEKKEKEKQERETIITTFVSR
jgi:hypothetical protein